MIDEDAPAPVWLTAQHIGALTGLLDVTAVGSRPVQCPGDEHERRIVRHVDREDGAIEHRSEGEHVT